jgi:hypothetical protein
MKVGAFLMSCCRLHDAFLSHARDLYRPPSIVAPDGDRPFSAIYARGAGGI